MRKYGLKISAIVIVIALWLCIAVLGQRGRYDYIDPGVATGNWIPDANNVYDLGSATNRWKEGWFGPDSVHIGNFTIRQDTVDDDGLETAGSFHAATVDGVSGNFCFHEGTEPVASNASDGGRLWVDPNGVLQHQKSSDAGGGSKTVIVDDGAGNVGIGTTDPKRQFDFNGANARTQRYTDSDLSTNLGYQSFGAGNLSGEYNSAFGRQTLYSITSGGNNCAFGSGALYSATTGGNNIAMGYSAGKSITGGNHNISLGYKSGQAISTGNNNISIGGSNNYVGTGSKNIIIGYNIDLPVDAGNNQLSIGNLIYGTGLDGVDKAVSTGNVGIGVPTPNEKLDVVGNIKVSGNLTDGTNSLTVANAKSAYDHISLTNNPHSVTKSQVGLGNVPNTNIAYASAIPAGSFNSAEVANLRSAKLDDGSTPWIIPADDLNQTEVDNLRAGKLDNGTTPWLGRYSYSQHPATSTWTSSGQVDYMEIRYYLQRWQYKIMHGSYGAAYIRNFRLSNANPYTTQHDVNPTIDTWYYFSSSASYDSLYDAGDYVELRIYSDNAGFQGVVTIKAMRNGNDLIAFTLSQGVVD